MLEEPIDPVLYMLTYGVILPSGFRQRQTRFKLIKEGHGNTALFTNLLHYPSFNDLDDAKHLKATCAVLDEGHDVTDLDAAMHVVNMARREGREPTACLTSRTPDARINGMAEL